MKGLICSFGLLIGLMICSDRAEARQRWQPFKLHPQVKQLDLHYEIQTQDNRRLVYGIQVQRLGNQKVHLKIQSEADLSEEDLGAQTLMGLWGMYGITPLVFVNPAYMMFYGQMDLKVGEKMSFYGAGYAKVSGEKEVGGRRGKVVEFYQQKDGKDRLVNRTVIDPLIFIPIENVLYDDQGRIQTRMTLLKGEVQ